MPPKQSGDSAAYKQLKQDIAAGTIGRLYVFHGEEAYLRDYYLGQMKTKLVPAGLEEFNLHTVQGRDCDPKRLAQEIDALPMMSPRTMVLVYDYDLFKAPAGDKEALTALFADLPDYVCLVFIYDLIEYKPDARTKLAAALKQQGAAVKFTRQEQGDLVDWVRRRFRALDHDIDSELARYLIFLCGDLMNGLISEIGKIGSYASHRVVTRADIDAVATPQLDAVVFQMTDAIAAGNFDKAASVLGDLLHMGEPPIKLLSVLGRQLRQSLGLHAFQKRAAFIADPAANAPAVEFQILPLEAAVLKLHVPGVFVHPGDQLALGIVGHRRAVHHEHKGQRGGA